ncbi:MAG: hypothetical protein RBR42_13220, partial [Desulfomicrobium sp.]|nr:hypothetical protein [Desulfomicrobium sp.]
ATSKFGSVTLGKTTTATTFIGTGSNATLTFGSGVSINADNTFTGGVNINTIVKGNITANGRLNFYTGTLRLERASGTQSIQMAGTNNRVNNLLINCGETVTLNNQLEIMGDLTIQAGTLDPQNNTLYVSGDWNNEAGPEYFTEGSGKVVLQVIINKGEKGSYDQYINYSEDFNILEINNAYGDVIINSLATTVTCNQYDWTNGGIKVQAGTFTAEDLADNGIFGRYTLSGTGTINLTNDDGYVDLNGTTLNISGGNFNVYGGTTDSYWPFSQNASLTMSAGVLNFAETGIRVNASTTTLTSNITGGTIKTAKDFINYRSDFNPAGGTIEMYGPTDAVLFCVGTAALYGVKINKAASKDGEGTTIIYPRIDRETGEVIPDESRAQIVNLTSTIIFNGNFLLTSGTFNSNSLTIQAKRDWTNNAGAGSFNPGTGRVIFNGGNYHQYCYNETFNVLEVAKASGGSFRLSSGSVTCAQYDWTAGSIDVNTGTFTALDLYDNGIFGGYFVNPGGTINLYQDASQWIDLCGNITFTGGGTINIFGGSSTSYWPYNNNASITMNAGVLDFKNHGIFVTTSAHTLATSITGGTIRTAGTFACNRTDFNPTGGTIELYGNQNANLSMTAGSLYNLSINKSVANNVSLTSNATLTGGLTVNSGTLNMNGKTLATATESAVNNGGVLHLNAGSALLISGSWWLNINQGGLLEVIGDAGNPAMISRNGAFGYIYLNVMSGGTISARNALFHYFNPLLISSGGIIDPDNPFDDCQFRFTATGMLWVQNEQTLLIRNVEFLTPATGYNIRKSVNSGELTFKDATGNYAGAAYENDPYNRIHWTATQPGLWTGVVSTNWHTAGNWDDGVVPTSTVDVTIPASAPHMPVISTHANCKNLTLNGTLTINDPTLTVSGNATIAGHLTLNYELARFVVMGDLSWQSGSTASQNDIDTEIQVYGNFTFDAGSNVQLNNGGVRFRGTVNKNIINHSANSWFYNLVSHKTSTSAIDFSDASSEPLKVTGSLSTETGAKFTSSSGLNIVLHHDLVSYGTFELDWPRIVFSGTDQYIQPNVNDYFYHLNFNQSGTVTINTSNSNVLQVRGGITILSGVFNAGSSTIKVRSGWVNEVGPGAFIAGNSRVIFEGFLISDIYNNENFNILEINKSAGNVMVNGTTVTCSSFDWTNGQLRVANGGVFTAYDLVDDGIFADIELQSGSTVNLYQDSYQRVDLGGKLWIMGGSTVNVFGGNGWSQWPYGANATLYMTDGTLDFKDQGINVNFMSPNTLTLDLTGGVIRTPVGFFCNRPDFDPEPSTLEIYGPGNSSIDMQSGLLWDVNINKTGTEDEVLINSNLTANSVIVNSGVLKSTPNSNLIFRNAYAYDNGTIWLTEGTDIKLKGSYEFAANGGKFILMGEPDNYVSVGRHGTNYVNFYVGNGGNISARYAHFSYLLNGPFVMNTGIVDADNAFAGCSFENGGYYQFRIENNQDLTIQDAHFPTASAPYNAGKLSNQGSVTFFNATGAFAGEAFEDDPHNRIHWVTPVPGLWTGAVSTDWFTAGNWSDGNVPTDDINVEIPADRMFMPVISGAQAFCHNLEVFGTLTINNNSLQAGGNADFHGTLAMNDWQAFLKVQENIFWHSGSMADITAIANIRVYGNWSFLEGSQAQIENGAVLFAGTTPSTILCNSDESWFNHVEIEKSAMNYTYFDESSLFPLRTNNLYVFATAGFSSEGKQVIIVRGNVGSYGVMTMEGGSLILAGVNPIIAQNTGDYFHNLHFNQTGTATINTVNTNVVNIKNDLVIISGIFEAGGNVINVGGDWDNQAGSAAFNKGTSRVVFNGNITQFCSAENFHILEVDNSVDLLYNQAYSTITCDIYDWTNGGLWISPGNFSALALADDGLFGTFAIFGGTMELHQDVSKSVDLIGEIIVGYNATLNVYGGNGMSNWGQSGDASVTMGYGTGVLDFKNSGVNIADQAPYQFTGNISAGTIRTVGSFYATSPGFNPAGGTVELYGEQGAIVLTDAGSHFWNLRTNKPVTFNPRVSMYSTKVTNELIVQQGLCELFSTYTFEIGNIIVQDDGWLANNGAIVKMSSLVVNSGGYLTNEGFEEVICTYTNLNPGEKYSFTIESGSYMLVYGTLFENMDENGIYISAGAIVTEYEAFKNCEFRNGAPGPYPLLTIENDQDLIIENAIFPTNTWGGQYNVRKQVDAGSVTFINPSGDFAGSDFENDPYNRIFWGDEFATQLISLPAGWSGISSYAIPSQPAMEDVFAPISDEMIIAQTMTEMFYPGQNINTIGNWVSQSAYKVKTSAACTLPVTGEYESDLTVSLNAGWSLLPVVSPVGADADDLFSLVDALVIA